MAVIGSNRDDFMSCKRNYIPVEIRGKYVHIDECIAELIEQLNDLEIVTTVASCCGHGIYPKTIVIRFENGTAFEMHSGIIIPRKRNFYRKDKKGFYYIPETLGVK